MSRRSRTALALVVVVVVTSVGAAGAAGAASRVTTTPGKVLVIAAPRLTWAEVQRVRPTHLEALFERSALASMSVRVADSSTTPGAAYLTLGAGNRATSDASVDGEVLDQGETFDGDSALNVYRRLSGVRPHHRILALGFPRLENLNQQDKFGTEIGSFASAMDGAGRRVSVVANADLDPEIPRRQAGLFGADRTGQVGGGAVDPELLVNDELAPFGVRLDQTAVLGAFDQSWARSDVDLVELSDLERAEQARSDMTPAAGDRQFDATLRESDRLVGRLLSRVDLRRDTVIVVGPTSPLAQDQLTVFSIAGPGIAPGWATSSTTRRDGFVTLTDVAPTLLDDFGVKVPESMSDTVISTSGVDRAPLATRIDHLVTSNARTLVRDGSFGPIAVAWVVILIVDLVLAVLCLARFRQLAPLATVLALVVLSMPPVSFLAGLLPLQHLGPAAFGALLYGVTVVVSVAGAWFGRKRPLVAPLALIGSTWLVLAVDIVSGGNLQINTVFGYSPVVAGRFAGFGNQAFSMFAFAAVIMVTAAWERIGARPEWKRWFVAGSAVFLLLSIVLDGFPGLGSDVGGVLALVPTTVVVLMTVAGRRVRVRTVVVIGAVTVAVLAAFAGLDLARPAKERTHLGRFVAQLFNGQGSEVIQRKLAANWSVFTSSFLTWVIPVALVYIAYLTWRPNHTLQAILRRYPGFRLMGAGGLILGVLSMALNDSGVSMPAVMLTIGLAYTTILALGIEVMP